MKEPGPTGSLWRIHYSVQLPSMSCDFLKITPTKGKGTGESFFQYSIKKGDYIIADRGYSTPSGIHHLASKGAHVIVRVNTASLVLQDMQSQPFDLLAKLNTVQKTGEVRSWNVLIPSGKLKSIQGRLCVIRKNNEAIKLAHKKLKTNASKKSSVLKPETLEYAKYIIVFTTFARDRFTDIDILNWYRCRWQVELVFKRFKSIAQLGHLPKHSDDSAKAWLYGKLLVALLTHKLITYANFFPPGDISWKGTRPCSLWREFNFAYSQVQHAIKPCLSLERMINEWHSICKLLSENKRKRKLQLQQYFFI